MKKLLSIILFIFCIFTFNTNFCISNAIAADNAPVKQEQTIPNYDATSDDEILDQPIFQKDKKIQNTKKVTGKLSSLIIKLIGGVALLLVVMICASFIWIANLQRQKEKRKKKLSANADVIDAVDNFARRRIK